MTRNPAQQVVLTRAQIEALIALVDHAEAGHAKDVGMDSRTHLTVIRAGRALKAALGDSGAKEST